MYKLILSILSIVTILACNAVANSKTDSFKVWGNCGMCKKTIENALSEKGIKGNWDKKSKIITVSYDSLKYTSGQVSEIICAAGYDTDNCRGNDMAYDSLHKCCKYERKNQ